MLKNDKAGQAFARWLGEAVARVRTLEEKGSSLLGDDDAYRAVMLEKALLVAGLHEESAPFLKDLEEKDRAYPEDRLRAFSESAALGLRLGSVFYMSALLFPEDHQAGEPNELEALAAELSLEL